MNREEKRTTKRDNKERKKQKNKEDKEDNLFICLIQRYFRQLL